MTFEVFESDAARLKSALGKQRHIIWMPQLLCRANNLGALSEYAPRLGVVAPQANNARCFACPQICLTNSPVEPACDPDALPARCAPSARHRSASFVKFQMSTPPLEPFDESEALYKVMDSLPLMDDLFLRMQAQNIAMVNAHMTCPGFSDQS